MCKRHLLVNASYYDSCKIYNKKYFGVDILQYILTTKWLKCYDRYTKEQTDQTNAP